jgi:N-acetylglucosaminyldiphosphoundecaprenol N-acetyl-beta-D-mannosaminyltransferase
MTIPLSDISGTVPNMPSTEIEEKRTPGTIRQIPIFGVPFQCVSQHEALMAIERFIEERVPRQVVLANAYTVALAQRDAALLELLQKATLVLADGMSLVWGGRWIGARLPQRVAGPDLMEALCRLASRNGYRVFLAGTSEGTMQKLREKLLRLCPELQIAGAYSPPMCECLDEDENMKILSMLKDARADILFVGMSCPKQEKWIANNLHRLPVTVSVGVGAAFDFLSGTVPRAPLWLRHCGLEWFYRLCREPRRLWKRYLLGNFIFLSLLGSAWVRYHLRKSVLFTSNSR